MKTAVLTTPCALALVTALLCACGAKPSAESASGAAPAAASASVNAPAGGAGGGGPVSVVTVRAKKQDMAVNVRATGLVAPLQTVDIKPQVSALVTKVHIREGDFVKAGQVLFTLDTRADEANVAKARAQMAKDEATLADARRQYARSQELFSQHFISQGAVDTSLAAVESLTATVAADQAAIEAAKVPLSYGRVVAPLSGRAGAISVAQGSVVQANLTALVTITQLDPIAVAFSIPQRNLSDALGALAGDKSDKASSSSGGAAVTASLADGGGTFEGRLQFVDNAVDAASGTVKLKAVFPNKDGKLWPGAFVEVAQTVRTLRDAVVVPQAAIVQGARGTTVYVVEDGKAVAKPMQVLYAQDGQAAVSGIHAGEAVVLDGKQNLRPGVAVAERARESKEGKDGKDSKDSKDGKGDQKGTNKSRGEVSSDTQPVPEGSASAPSQVGRAP